MKDIVNILLRIILLLLTLFLVTRIFKRGDGQKILSPATAAFSKGNAPDSTRRQIIDQLNKFQEGYSQRETSQVDAFMQSLYSRESILILGTSPGEVFSGYDTGDIWCSLTGNRGAIVNSMSTALIFHPQETWHGSRQKAM